MSTEEETGAPFTAPSPSSHSQGLAHRKVSVRRATGDAGLGGGDRHFRGIGHGMFPPRYRPSPFSLHRLRGNDHYQLRAPAALAAFLVPVIGAVLAGLTLWIGNRLIASVRQKSTTDYMEAVVVGNGVISLRASLVKTISALFSISTGASIGREGPLIQLSSLVASLVGRLRNCPIPQRRHLVACGAAAGMASAYNAPIAGAFFVAEIVLGTVVVESLGPLILASVTVLSRLPNESFLGRIEHHRLTHEKAILRKTENSDTSTVSALREELPSCYAGRRGAR